MWGQGKKTVAGKIDTLIGQQTEISGDVRFTGGLHVDGAIKGNVIASGEAVLMLSEHGRIEGDVRVPNVVLNGAVTGDVYAAERVELASRARVNGNVYYNLIEMAMGAEVNGNLVHKGAPAAQPVAESRSKPEEALPGKPVHGNS
jgi:cytoskeletal protein CcmA (bactofilin family)